MTVHQLFRKKLEFIFLKLFIAILCFALPTPLLKFSNFKMNLLIISKRHQNIDIEFTTIGIVEKTGELLVVVSFDFVSKFFFG